MTFLACADEIAAAPPEVVFDTLVDLVKWPNWMPASFLPWGAVHGTLTLGLKFPVRLDRAPVPTTLRVSVLERASEITWCGGLGPLLQAEHRFLFEAHGEGTMIRSVETWSGWLAGAMRFKVQPTAERIGAEQIASLARAAERNYRS